MDANPSPHPNPDPNPSLEVVGADEDRVDEVGRVGQLGGGVEERQREEAVERRAP